MGIGFVPVFASSQSNPRSCRSWIATSFRSALWLATPTSSLRTCL